MDDGLVMAGSASGQAVGTARPLVIAIDGPAGAGKSTVARALARRLGWEAVDVDEIAVSVVISFLPLRISETAWTGLPMISANSVTVQPRSSSSSRR